MFPNLSVNLLTLTVILILAIPTRRKVGRRAQVYLCSSSHHNLLSLIFLLLLGFYLMSSNIVLYTLFLKSLTLIKMNCPSTDLSLVLISFLSKYTERVVESRLADFLTEHVFSTHFSLPIPNSIIQKLLFLLFMIISSEPVASTKFLASVFLVFPLHLIPLIILS
jgi:hypothetical protein